MRRSLDAYYTPEKMLEVLIKRKTPRGIIYEPCAGKGHISQFLKNKGYSVITNDIDKAYEADTHLDARMVKAWHGRCVDWVVTNPPYSSAYEILQHAYRYANWGVAMFLRLSFLEPCRNREEFLKRYPPTMVLVLPRISFTDDGKKDMVTSMWAIWEKGCQVQSLEVISRSEIFE